MVLPSFSRRQVIAYGVAGAAGLTAGALALHNPWDSPTAQAAPSPSSATPISTGRTLVLLTMYGGNDGLNTVVPASDPAYQAARPSLGYQPDEVLELDDGLGLNPKLTRLQQLWHQGHLAIVRGVGYPNPNLSHFDSMDIWQTANPQSGTGPGWIGSWLDATTGDALQAVSVGATVAPALVGTKRAAAALESAVITLPGPARQQQAYASLSAPGPDRVGLLAACGSSAADLLATKRELGELNPALAGTAETTSLAGQLDLVAALIRAGAPTKVYEVSLSTFDTHADEKTAHEAKLAELDAAIGTFFTAIAGSPTGAGTVLMTYSEFGRRVAQNASGGTDHGTAAPLFVVGTSVKGGAFYGDQPSLGALDTNGNLVYNVDFRSVYATMLDAVIGVDPAAVLGGKFPTLDLL